MNWPITIDARRRLILPPLIGITASLAILVLGIVMYYLEVTAMTLEWFCVAGIVMAICLVVNRLISKPFLSIVRVEDGFVWIANAHTDFLKELPPWPGGATA